MCEQAMPAEMECLLIREYHAADQPVFERLYREWFAGHFHQQPEPVDDFVLQNPKEAILDKGGALLVAFCDGEAAGFVALKKEDSYTHQLTKMIIREEYRGRGLGEELCKAVIEKARELGSSLVVLFTHSSLKPAINLYKKLGFEEVPLEPGIYSPFRCDTKMQKWVD
jgi:ribosomal protein S18 acetylase RimI-like enzyme